MAEGIGEKLTSCTAAWQGVLAGVWVVLLCPNVRINTAWAYGAWDSMNRKTLEKDAPSISLPVDGPYFLTGTDKLDKNHNSSFHRPLILENSFEPVVFATHPELARFKTALVREGAAGAGMSGSGSTLFGLFREQSAAFAAASRLREQGTEYAVHGPYPL